MTENNYMYLSVILAITAIIFAVLYFTKPEQTIGDVYGGVTDTVMSCNEDLMKWKADYATVASSTEKQDALDDILEECQTELTKSKKKLAE